MPLNILGTIIFEGCDKVPYLHKIKKYGPYLAAIGAAKYLLRGRMNTWERNMHGKVYIVTGATSQGMGTSVIFEMASKGAQLVILVRRIDEWVSEWCEQLRAKTNNELIYLEQCDLSNLYDVRKFATKWLENASPRRLDGCVIMSGNMEPFWWFWSMKSRLRRASADGLEIQIATNFACVFHLLNLLQPAFKAQPPDRNVRIIITSCFLQAMGEVNVEDPLWLKEKYNKPQRFFSSSKLQLSLTMLELQRRIYNGVKMSSKDGRTGKNIAIVVVDPGLMRSISLRRVVSNGSILLLLFLYCIVLYPLLWLVAKSGYCGGQVILHALMTPELEEVNRKDPESVPYMVNCQTIKFSRKEFEDVELQQKLYDNTEREILETERRVACKRNNKKKKV